MEISIYLILLGLVFVYYAYKKIKDRRKLYRTLRDFSSKLGWSKYKLEDLDLHYLERKGQLGKKELDDLTWGDLELDELFIKTQAFYCTLGANHVYEAFHYLEDEKTLEKRKKLISMKEEDRELAIRELFYLGKEDGANLHFFIRDAGDFFLPSWLIYGLFYLMLLTLISLPFTRAWGLIFMGPLITINSLIYSQAQERISPLLYNVDYFQRTLKRARILERKLSNDLDWYKEELANSLDKFKGIRISPLGTSLQSTEMEMLRDMQNIFFLKNLRQYIKIGHRVKENQEAATRMVELLGELELALYMKALMANKELCLADFNADKDLSFKGLYHPVVEEPVPYDRKGAKRLLVTGSNASGKSTFMKSMALSVLYSQVVGYAFAESFSLSPGGLYTSMALRDSIERKESYFITEIKSLRRIIQATGEDFSYCFIDEILRGTNTIERIAASSSVLSQLAQTDSAIYVATHDIELTQMLEDYENVHFRESFEGDDIVFDYKLLEGPSDTNNAILLLGIMGFDEAIIKEARDKVEGFHQTRTWRKN